MFEPDPAMLDLRMIAALVDDQLTWSDKGVPAELWGLSIGEIRAAGLSLSRFPTPLLTLSAPALRHNVTTMAKWCADRGLYLAPHGKTCMAPQLWADQLAAGAWAISVANLQQLGVAMAYGVSRVLLANEIIAPSSLRWIADQLAHDQRLQLMCWADDVQTVALMEDALASHRPSAKASGRPLDVLVDIGHPGGRTGARDIGSAVAVARAIAAAPHMRLMGVGGYEGGVADDSDEASLAAVRTYLSTILRVHRQLTADGLYSPDAQPVVSAGGSAFFDEVAEVLGPLTAEGVRVVLRSGSYLTHDDGYYRDLSPLGEHPRCGGGRLLPALHARVGVSSQPERGLAVIDAGKRDLPYDFGLPRVQLRRPRDGSGDPEPLEGLTVEALDDQHGFVRWDPRRPAPIRIGDELRLGLSHPCAAFDKWRMILVIDDPDAADPVVVDLVRTYF